MATPARAAPRARARPAQAAPRPRPRPEPQSRRRAARPRVAGGVLWIVVVAALLAGIVALNVAVLRLNMEVERLDAQKEKLVAENAALASEHSSLAAAGRIEAVAREKLGLVPPVQTTYVDLEGRKPADGTPTGAATGR